MTGPLAHTLLRAMAALSAFAVGPVALAFAACVIPSCGARTDLTDTGYGSTAGMSTPVARHNGRLDSSADGADIVFCSIDLGPVPTDSLGAQICTEPFRYCVEIGGQWGCCTSPALNNGPGGSCIFL
jgi:hypothetical protein